MADSTCRQYQAPERPCRYCSTRSPASEPRPEGVVRGAPKIAFCTGKYPRCTPGIARFIGRWTRASRRGKEPEDLAHDPLSLIGLKQELRVRRAVDDDQLLWLRGSLILRANPGEPRSVAARV